MATVKPNRIENTTKVTTPTDPMLKRIPKKTTPTKVRIIDVDLDKVPVTSTISLETETQPNKKITSTSLKRSSNGINEIPQKKAKIISPTKPTNVVQNIKKKIPVTSRTIISFLTNDKKIKTDKFHSYRQQIQNIFFNRMPKNSSR